MVLKEGKAQIILISTGLSEPYMLVDAKVTLYDSGVIHIKGTDDDPSMELSCHLSSCEIAWNFTPVDVPIVPSGDGSVTPFRRKKK